jgi:hypothetical protein
MRFQGPEIPTIPYRFSKMSFHSTRKIIDSRLVASISHLISVKIQDDNLPPDTKITVKSYDSVVSYSEPSVAVHTFPVTPFVVIQIL